MERGTQISLVLLGNWLISCHVSDMADDNVTLDLLFELVKDTNQRTRNVEVSLRDLKDNVISLREDVHGARGDVLRQEKALASVEVDIDRIKTRLELIN